MKYVSVYFTFRQVFLPPFGQNDNSILSPFCPNIYLSLEPIGGPQVVFYSLHSQASSPVLPLSLGFYEWWNWFDVASWYPLGRVVGQTLYPGLMTTAYIMYRALHLIGFYIDIKDVCVFTAPVFSGATALAAYLLTKEVGWLCAVCKKSCMKIALPCLNDSCLDWYLFYHSY